MTAILQPGGWKRSPGRLFLWAIPAILLIIPAAMMLRAAEGWAWGRSDFAVAALLLFGAAGLIDLAIRVGGTLAYRFGAALAVLVSFLLV
ncbi:MAG TPA: hypothetical protein VFS49_10150, partial [Croceibacterium sp.]|nr:hypothetical protein [Croceibacterium sp.]